MLIDLNQQNGNKHKLSGLSFRGATPRGNLLVQPYNTEAEEIVLGTSIFVDERLPQKIPTVAALPRNDIRSRFCVPFSDKELSLLC